MDVPAQGRTPSEEGPMTDVRHIDSPSSIQTVDPVHSMESVEEPKPQDGV
jgi:hypothetical protein